MAGRVRSPHLRPVLDAGPAGPEIAPPSPLSATPAGVARTLGPIVPDDQPWYVVTPLSGGPSLATLLGRLPASAVLDVALQLCDALTHLHELELHDFADLGLGDGATVPGLLHRDVRPANVIVERDGRVTLGGIGLWRLVPPGAWAAEDALDPLADPSVDLFGLACTLHALVTGKPPFADRSEVRRVEDRLAEPGFLAALDQAQPGLGDVLYPCFRRDSAHRWRTARDLGEALRALGAPVGGLGMAVPVDAFRKLEPFSTPAVAPSADLVGRAEEVDGIVRQLKGAGRAIVLDGPPGIGRTQLASAVAARLSEELGYAVLHVHPGGMADAGAHAWAMACALGVGLDPVEPNTRLGRVLSRRGKVVVVLEAREESSETLAPAVGEWMSQAPEARFLIVGLLPGLRAARRLVLEPLGGTVGAELLGLRAYRPALAHDPLAVELAVRLRGWPGAIGLAGRALTRGASLESLTTRVKERLSLRRDGLVVMLEVVRELSPEWASVALRQLAVIEGPFGIEAAAAVLDLSAWPEAPFASGVLAELDDAGLVEEVVGGVSDQMRYRVPMHVRGWILASRPSLDLELSALRRAMHLAQLGTGPALGAIERRVEGFAPSDLEEEVPDLLGALKDAVERGQQRAATSLLLAMVAILRDRMPVSAALGAASLVLAMEGLAPPQLALAHSAAAEICALAGMSTEAIRHRERALVFSVRCGDRRTEALLRAAGSAIGNIQHGLRIAEATCDPHLSGRVRLRLAEAMVAEGQLEDAHEHLGVAIERLGAASDRAGEARARRLLGRVMIELHDARGGLAQLTTALATLHQLRETEAEADGRVELAALHLDLGHPDEARAMLEEALREVRAAGDATREATVASALGDLELWTGALDLALQHLDDAERVQRRLVEAAARGRGESDAEALALTLVRLGAVHLELGRARDARPVLEEALKHAQGHPTALAEAHLGLAALELYEGHHEEATARLLALLPAARRTAGARLGRVMTLLGRRSVREGEPDSALERLQTAVQDLAGRSVGWAALARVELARVMDASGSQAQAEEVLQRAIDELRSAGFAPALGHALCARARLRRLGDRNDEAAADLDEARDIAKRCGVRTRSPLQRAIDAAT